MVPTSPESEVVTEALGKVMLVAEDEFMEI